MALNTSYDILHIANNYVGTTNQNSTYSATASTMYNLNYYRGKWYYKNSLFHQFPTEIQSISINHFYNTDGNCEAVNCNCDCNCSGDCGTGNH